MTTVYLIRHGQASLGADDYDRLSPLGHQQAQHLGRVLKPRFDPTGSGGAGLDGTAAVRSGSLRRQQETAEALAAALPDAARCTPDTCWNEYDHLELIARYRPEWRDPRALRAALAAMAEPHREFQRHYEAALSRWAGGRHDSDYRESWSTFRDRAAAALASLSAAPHGGTQLVLTSGGLIAAAVCAVLELSSDHWLRLNRVIANASLTKLRHGRNGWHLLSFNDHSHFEPPHHDLLTYR